MAFTKQVKAPGEVITSEWANHIQTQYEEAEAETKYHRATGSNAIAIATGNTFSYTDGRPIKWVQELNSTGAVTIAINAGPAYALKEYDGSAPTLEAGKAYEAYYDSVAGFFFLRPSGVKISGQEQTTAKFLTNIAANEAVQLSYGQIAINSEILFDVPPAGACKKVALSPCGNYLAVSCTISPYMYIYKKNGNTFNKLPDPDILPTGAGAGIDFNPLGTYLAIAHSTSPYITVYKRSGDTFTKCTTNFGLTTTGVDVCFGSSNLYTVSTSTTTGYYYYSYTEGETSFTRATAASVQPTGTPYSISAVNGTVVIGHAISPYMTVYKNSYTKVADPTTLPTGTVKAVAIRFNDYVSTVDEYVIAVQQAGTNVCNFYTGAYTLSSLSKETFTLSLPTATTLNNIKFSSWNTPIGSVVSCVSDKSPYYHSGYLTDLENYGKGSPDKCTKETDISPMPAECNGIAISSDSRYAYIVSSISPYIYACKRQLQASSSTPDIEKPWGYGYALESGIAGQTKKIMKIWEGQFNE